MTVDGICSLDPEGGRRIRKEIIRRRTRIGFREKTRWTEKRKWKDMEKGLVNRKFTFKTRPDGPQKLSARTVDNEMSNQ